MVSGPLIANELAFRVAEEGFDGKGFIDYQFSDALTGHVLFSQREFSSEFIAYPNTDWSGDVDETNYTVEARLNYQPENENISGVAGIYLYKETKKTTLIAALIITLKMRLIPKQYLPM